METLIWLAATGAASLFGYFQTRRFIRSRLRFVDAAHAPATPLIVGAAATLIAAPIVWLLPVVGGVTALLFGTSVGVGALHGSRDTKRLPR
jgi:hypothetical protein